MNHRIIILPLLAVLLGCQSHEEIKLHHYAVDKSWKPKDTGLETLDPPHYRSDVYAPDREENTVLADSFACWLMEECGIAHNTDSIPEINKSFFLHEAEKQMAADEDYKVDYLVRKVFESEHLITFVLEYGVDFYGAHGFYSTHGATFLKASGERLAWNMFRTTDGLQPLLKKGLDDYFSNGGQMAPEINPNALPMPNILWVEEEGIRMLYDSYEIASFADGTPNFIISIEDAKPLLHPLAYEILR